MKSFYDMLLKMEADQPPPPPPGGDINPSNDPTAPPPSPPGDMGGMPGGDVMGGQPQAKPKKYIKTTTAWDAIKEVLKGENKQKQPLPPKKDELKTPNFKSLFQ